MCAGNVLRWEDNEDLRKGMNEVLDFLEDSQEIDGFLMPIDKSKFAIREYPHYVRIWLTYGLLAAGLADGKQCKGIISYAPSLRADIVKRCDLTLFCHCEVFYKKPW